MKEVLLIAGGPGSGKSTIAKKFVSTMPPGAANHLSVGDRKRAIVDGSVPSKYADSLRDKSQTETKMGRSLAEFRTGLDDQKIPATDLMLGLIEEFIDDSAEPLTVLDGFPRYRNSIEPFRDRMRDLSIGVIALCVVTADPELRASRIKNRGSRSSKEDGASQAAYVAQRQADHEANILPTIDQLAAYYPTYEVDGGSDIDANASYLRAIYELHSKFFTSTTPFDEVS